MSETSSVTAVIRTEDCVMHVEASISDHGEVYVAVRGEGSDVGGRPYWGDISRMEREDAEFLLATIFLGAPVVLTAGDGTSWTASLARPVGATEDLRRDLAAVYQRIATAEDVGRPPWRGEGLWLADDKSDAERGVDGGDVEAAVHARLADVREVLAEKETAELLAALGMSVVRDGDRVVAHVAEGWGVFRMAGYAGGTAVLLPAELREPSLAVLSRDAVLAAIREVEAAGPSENETAWLAWDTALYRLRARLGLPRTASAPKPSSGLGALDAAAKALLDAKVRQIVTGGDPQAADAVVEAVEAYRAAGATDGWVGEVLKKAREKAAGTAAEPAS